MRLLFRTMLLQFLTLHLCITPSLCIIPSLCTKSTTRCQSTLKHLTRLRRAIRVSLATGKAQSLTREATRAQDTASNGMCMKKVTTLPLTRIMRGILMSSTRATTWTQPIII